MKLVIDISEQYDETEIVVKCKKVNAELQKIINMLQNSQQSLLVQKDGLTEKVRYDEVCYFESVDDLTFVYTEKAVYRCKEKLYELEELLKDRTFVRISKSCILNIDYLESVKAAFNGKLEAMLSNGEKVIINRHYVSTFKKKFGL
ncbi:MAG: LytTR family transcriptional regulator [Clostridia bacterium]|nr:LytTR family transcriptional regulator [Clostridia bacterium]